MIEYIEFNEQKTFHFLKEIFVNVLEFKVNDLFQFFNAKNTETNPSVFGFWELFLLVAYVAAVDCN